MTPIKNYPSEFSQLQFPGPPRTEKIYVVLLALIEKLYRTNARQNSKDHKYSDHA